VTLYALLLDRCGLSHREAAALSGVRLDTIKSWSSGRNRAPAGVLAELRTLYAQIERAAVEALGEIERHPEAEMIEIGLAADDHEAQALGWPCVGAQEAMLGLVVARCRRPVRIVPRGSTVATAAATDAHDGRR
jgi:hypothetical protein